jgi:branched-chain amino acid transport system permease protein
MVSFWGPVIGAAVFFVARDVLGAATETWVLWYGLLFMVVVLFKPEGIAGLFQDAGTRRHARAAPAPAE